MIRALAQERASMRCCYHIKGHGGLKSAVQMHKILKELRLNLAKTKTFIGKLERSVNFLGFEFTLNSLSVSQKTQERRDRKLDQLLEQGASIFRIEQYLKRWTIWVKSGLKGIELINLREIVKNNHSILNQLINDRVDLHVSIISER